MNNYSIFKSISKFFLVLTAMVPLIVSRFSVYPFVFGKSVLYTGLVELSLLSAAIYFLFDEHHHASVTFRSHKMQWGILALFLVSLLISTILSTSPYTAFWGSTEKGEGFIYYIHFFVFIILSHVLFEKIDWQRLAKGFMACAVIIALLAWGERFTFSGLDFQPVSSLGNPAYLAAYLILALAFVALTATEEETEKYIESYRVLYIFVGITLLMLQVRGAVLALATGIFGYALYYAWNSRSLAIRRFSALFCLGVVVFSSVFLVTRAHPFWKNVPVLKKFAVVSVESGSVAERVSAWKAGIEGFRQRPVFGWGSEQFETVYNAYGITNIEKYKESWFTAPHNKIIDILVSTGVVGLVAYLLLIGVVLWGIRKRPLAVALFSAYVVQNMFIFDTISSSMVLFAIVGYLLSEKKHQQHDTDTLCSLLLCKIVAVFFIGISIIAFTYIVVIPIQQQRAFSNFLSESSGEKLESLFDDATTPYTSHQGPTRISIVNLLREYDAVKDPRGRTFFIRAVNALVDVHLHDPSDMQTVVPLLESYIDLAVYDSSYFEKADELAKNALRYAPNTYKIIHLRSVALVGMKKYQEAQDLLMSALRVYPNSARTMIYLAWAEHSRSLQPVPLRTKEILARFDEQRWTFEKRDISLLILLLARENANADIRHVSNVGLQRFAHSKYFYQYALAVEIVEKNEAEFSRVLDALTLAPYAATLPIQEWKVLRNSRNWSALSKDPFFADAFGNLSAI